MTGFSFPIFSTIELAKQSKALEAGLQLLNMVGQWWAQSQAAACILSQVLKQLARRIAEARYVSTGQ